MFHLASARISRLVALFLLLVAMTERRWCGAGRASRAYEHSTSKSGLTLTGTVAIRPQYSETHTGCQDAARLYGDP